MAEKPCCEKVDDVAIDSDLACRLFLRAYWTMPGNERVAFLAAMESRAAVWRNVPAFGYPKLWPIVVKVEQDPQIQAERY